MTNWCLAWKGLEDIIPTSADASGAIKEKIVQKGEENETEEGTTTTTGTKPKVMVLGHSMEKNTPGRCMFPSPRRSSWCWLMIW